MAKAKFTNNRSQKSISKVRIAGGVRHSQLITTYGIGSIVDFVRDTVIIAGVDDWDTGKNVESAEGRKLYNENLQSLTGVNYFIEPKAQDGSFYNKSKDTPAFVFPELLYCPTCKRIVSAKEAANANPKRPNKCCLDGHDGKPCSGTLVASRFIVVCEDGHMDDFPYSWWVHGNTACSSGRTPRISMYNIGDRSDIESLFLKCENCGKTCGMARAFAPNAFQGENGYPCTANHPHLEGKCLHGRSDCAMPLKTKLRSSSSVYFAATVSALTIPPWSSEAVKIIEREYNAIIHMPNPRAYLQGKATATASIEQLLVAYDMLKARKGSTILRREADIYQDEYRILSGGDIELCGFNNGKGDYSAFTAQIPKGFEQFFEQITIADKLTIVEALKGFTRVKPWSGDNSEKSPDNKRIVPLSAYPKDWLPAVELRGEGVFIRFKETALNLWKARIGTRYEEMAAKLGESYLSGRKDRFSPEYVLLHTFAHLLIRQLSNECGYSAASLKEKIYSTFTDEEGEMVKMHGLLIYLGSSDCDGSLGGLISVAQNTKQFRLLLENMLCKASWCSADPLCISSMEQGFSSLNYSACHDCVLLPETSCEFRNVLLDRVSVVGTPDEPQLGLMGEFLRNFP